MDYKYELLKIDENHAYLFNPISLDILKATCVEENSGGREISKKRTQVYDYSNFVDIRQIYIQIQTPETMKTITDLTSLYELKNCEVLEHKEEHAEETRQQNRQPYWVLEHFLEQHLNHCKKEISKVETKEVMRAVDTINQYTIEEKRRADIVSCPCILDIYHRLRTKSRRLCSCDWGVSRIFIGKDGGLYRCSRHQETGTAKNIQELGLLYLVNDILSCKDCSIRYLCGGKCEYEAGTTRLCTVMREVIQCIFKKYIIDELENDR